LEIKRLLSIPLITIFCFTVFLVSFPAVTEAREGGSPEIAKNIFIDTCIGAAIGILLGLGITAAQDDSDWVAGIGTGGAIGGVGGLLFGMLYESKPLFYSDNGKMQMQIPRVSVKLEKDDNMLLANNLSYNVSLFEHKF